MATPQEQQAMRRALALAADPSVVPGANPRVGCVLLDREGRLVAEGVHRGAGTPHAEVDALTNAGDAAHGCTAVVTLEPCHHHGRTGPCTQALIAAGVTRVVFAQQDPNPVAAGGAAALREAGVDVEGGVDTVDAERLNNEWTFAVRAGRPHVTWKYAATLDGRVAASDGSSRWITSAASRREVHAMRAAADAVVVGTGTVLTDDPQLSARDDAGQPLALDRQPLRVVVGRRPVGASACVRDSSAPTEVIEEHQPLLVLERLWHKGIRRVLLEGGPTLAAAFLAAGAVDRVVAYVAPAVLGAGPHALGDLGVTSISGAVRLTVTDVARVGDDVRITAEPPTSRRS